MTGSCSLNLVSLDSDVVPLAMNVMDGSITAEEQHILTRGLIDMAAKLRARVAEPWVIDGDATTDVDNGQNGTAAHREP